MSGQSRGAFTLVELMIVVIVIAILVAAAFPIWRFAVKKAYTSEAKASLATIRSAELTQYAEHQTFLAVAEGNIENDPTDGDNPRGGVTVRTNGWCNSSNCFKVKPGDRGIETRFIATADGSKSSLNPNPVADIRVTSYL